eukprot:912584-Rhodomonas_salina.1
MIRGPAGTTRVLGARPRGARHRHPSVASAVGRNGRAALARAMSDARAPRLGRRRLTLTSLHAYGPPQSLRSVFSPACRTVTAAGGDEPLLPVRLRLDLNQPEPRGRRQNLRQRYHWHGPQAQAPSITSSFWAGRWPPPSQR